jgi:uncharacterized protein DUF6268
MKKMYFIGLIVVFFFTQFVNAQPPGPSFSASYDFYPFSKLTDPDAGTFLEDVEIRVATLRLKATYPMALSQTTLLIHELLYDRFDMDYVKWDKSIGGAEIPHGHAVKYNLMIMRTLSEKWSFLAFITPGLASDFRSKLSTDDFTIEAALVFVYKFSEKFSLGGGLAYSRQFGEPMPLPVIALDWNNGSNMRARAILPSNLEFWYMMSKRFELGLVLSGDGNEYHGDPDRYGGDNPKLKYSVFTMGPSLKYRFTKTFSLNLDAGYVLGRTFEFTNEIGGTEVEDILDLENAAYVRIGFQIGG